MVKFISRINDFKKKTVLIRIDLDFDIKSVSADFRLKKICETLNYCLKNGSKLILVSTKGKYNFKKDKKNSLKPFVKPLKKILKKEVFFIDRSPSTKYIDLIKESDRKIFMFENLNFYSEEEKNLKSFGKLLASFADIYINDSFAKINKKVASINSITEYLKPYYGLQIENEMNALDRIKKIRGKKILVLGGKKVFEKIKLIRQVGKEFDYILLGGVLANTFLSAKLISVGASKIDETKLIAVNKILKQFAQKIILPIDFLVSEIKDKRKTPKYVLSFKKEICKRPNAIVDLGPETIKNFSKIIKSANVIFYSGPMGIVEHNRSQTSSKIISRVIAQRSSGRAYGVVAGEASINLLQQIKFLKFMDHVSFSTENFITSLYEKNY